MKQLVKLFAVVIAFLPAIVWAHGAPRLKVEESITINAAPEKVWAVVSDFGGLATWLPVVEKSEATGNEKGATRKLTLVGGGTIDEVLKKVDAEKMTVMYAITGMSNKGEIDDHGTPHEVPVVPVSKYKAWISVTAKDGGSEVKWSGKFFRAYHGKSDHPPAELGDKAAKDTISGIYTSGLESLKAQLEK
jgi:mxaD protein